MRRRPWLIACGASALLAAALTAACATAPVASADGTPTAVRGAAPDPSTVAPTTAPLGTAAFTFALMGDMPYSRSEVAVVDRMIDEINADPSIAFVIHVGDIKGGSEPCTDRLLQQRLAQMQRIARPLVYSPGDNEWTDCHREKAGRFNPLERLGALRRLFFPDPTRSLGTPPLVVTSQSRVAGFAEFVENVRFVYHGVVFATVHVVGSNNDLDPWRGIDRTDSFDAPRADRAKAFDQRLAAALQWIDAAFDAAEASDAAAVVLAMQANPLFERRARDADRQGFNAVIEKLRYRATRFARPVLLLHGDQHLYLVDRPFERASDAAAEPQAGNGGAGAAPGSAQGVDVTRVQTFGSPLIRWVRVHVDPQGPHRFRIEPSK